MLLMIVAVWCLNALLNWLFLGLQVVPVQIQRRGWRVARSKGERIPVRSLWEGTSRTYTWIDCSLKSRGPATGWVQIPVQGRLPTSAGQARPRIICGPASHLPTSYLRPTGHNIGFARLLRPLVKEPCVSPLQSRRTGDAHVDHGPLPTWLVRLHLAPPGSTWPPLLFFIWQLANFMQSNGTWSAIPCITNYYFFLFQ